MNMCLLPSQFSGGCPRTPATAKRRNYVDLDVVARAIKAVIGPQCTFQVLTPSFNGVHLTKILGSMLASRIFSNFIAIFT